MKPIEKYKKEILLEVMAQKKLPWEIVKDLPRNKGVRSFICELGAEYALNYALYVDKCPHDETRTAACKDSQVAFRYADEIDNGPHDETREACFRDPDWEYMYRRWIDKTTKESREIFL